MTRHDVDGRAIARDAEREAMERIAAVYAAADTRELAGRYDSWAPDYDRQVACQLGYVAPGHAARELARHVPLTARVLDAGAGTGLVGQALFDLGYRDLTGIDVSGGMLARARARNVYTACHQMDLNARLSFASASFDAVVAVGVLTDGHASPGCLDELVRVTGPGGRILFSLRCDRDDRYSGKIASLTEAGAWSPVAISDPFDCFVQCETRVELKLWTFVVA